MLKTKRDIAGNDAAFLTATCNGHAMADDYNKLPRSYSEARKIGSSKYFTGRPCRYGHLAPRWASGANCSRCTINRTNENNKKTRRGEGGDEYRKMRREQRQRWLEANPEARERYYAKQRKGGPWYRLKSKVAARVDTANARARRMNCEGVICIEEILNLIEKQNNGCANCHVELDEKFHIDHNMPLSLGGSNWIANIQILCGPCNKRKHAMNPHDWARMNGRLL